MCRTVRLSGPTQRPVLPCLSKNAPAETRGRFGFSLRVLYVVVPLSLHVRSVAKRPLANRISHGNLSLMPSAIAKRRNVKTEAIKLVRGLPESSTWDDLMYRIYVRQKVDAGLADLRAGRVHSHASIRKEFALP